MDFNTLLNALTLSDAQAEKNSPYAGVSDFGDAFGQRLLQDSAGGKLSTGEGVLAGLLTGLLGGGAKNLTNTYRQQQNQMASDYLQRTALGESVMRPAGMHPSVFAPVENAGQIFNIAKKAEDRAAVAADQRDFQNAVGLKVIEKTFDNPWKAKRAGPMVAPILQAYLGGGKSAAAAPSAAEPSDVGAPAQAEPLAEGAPNLGRTYEDYLEQFQGNEGAASVAMQRDLEKPVKDEGRLMDLRKEFQSLPEVKAYITSDIGIQSLRKAAKDPSPTADLELIRGAIQAIEPGMAVREGEAAAVENSASIPEVYKAWLLKGLSGQSGLPPEVRKGILDIAERRYSAYQEKFQLAESFYRSQAERQRLPDPSGISYLSPRPRPMAVQMPGGPAIQRPDPPAPPPGHELAGYNEATGKWQIRRIK